MPNFQLFSFQNGFKVSELSNNIAVFNTPFSLDYNINGLSRFSLADLALSKKVSIDEIEIICDNLKDNYELMVESMYSLSGNYDNIYANLKNAKHICIPVDYYNYGNGDICTKLNNYEYEFLSTIIAMKDKYNFIPIFNNSVTKHYFKLLNTKQDWRNINVWNSCVFNIKLDSIEDMKLIKGQKITNSIINLEINWDNISNDYFLELVSVVNHLKRTNDNVVAMNSDDIEKILHWGVYGALKIPTNHSMTTPPEYKMVDFSNMIIYTFRPLLGISPYISSIDDNVVNINSNEYIFENTLFVSTNIGPRIAKAIRKNDKLGDITFGYIHNIMTLFNTSVFDICNSYVSYSVYLVYNATKGENKYVKVRSKDINLMLEDGVKNLKDMIISNVTIDRKDLNEVDFTNSTLRNVEFYNCKNFDKAIWNDTIMGNCKLVIGTLGNDSNNGIKPHLNLFITTADIRDLEELSND